MLGLKIELPEPRIPEVPVDYSENTIEHKTWDPAKEYAEVETEGVSDYRDKVSVKKSEILNARKKHTAFHKENNIDLQQVVEASGISKLFSKEANLKDYIKVQEILNKPKALRR